MIVRALTRRAIEGFRAYLAELRGGAIEEPPWDMLENPTNTVELPVEIDVSDERFADRRTLGSQLGKLLDAMPSAELERNAGLWVWLTLYWFDQLCPQRNDGERRPGQDFRFIVEFGRARYLHLLYGPYHVYRQHGPRSVVLLSGPVHTYSGLYQDICCRRDLISNRSIVEAALLLYVDPHTARLKRGCQSNRQPGAVRRFISVLQQLDLTYDIYGMTGPQIIDLLPTEFDRWRASAS